MVGRAGSRGEPVSVLLSSNLQLAISKAGPQEIRIWEWETGRQLGRLPHPSQITFHCLDPESRWLLVGGDGGEILLWDAKTMRERWRLLARGSRVLSGLILLDADINSFVWLSRVATLYFFAYFWIILPVLGLTEKPLPVPESISEPVLSHPATTPAGATASPEKRG